MKSEMKKKTIFSWIKEFLSIHGKGFDGTPPAPSVETVEKLIRRAVNEKQREENGKDQENDPDVRESAENVEETPEADSRKESCPYALKRNIVSSIEEVKRFAEEHELAATVVKALLALLAELASNTLKGKVSGTLLLTLLNALNFDKAREAAYRELEEPGNWTVDKIIGMAKMFFTGEDVPKSALLLAGKNLLESIQKIDYSKHPEIHISTKVNSVGWTVTNFHTVFGDIEIKREPTLDRLGWSNSGALIGDNRLVHYVYSEEHAFEDRVEGEEATRNGLLIWDAVALKGTCHLWINGEGRDAESGSAIIKLWDSEDAPDEDDIKDGMILYLTVNCPGIDDTAKAGQLWKATGSGSAAEWSRMTGEFF